MPEEKKFFEFAAYTGLTKHLGGQDATDHLAELCQIERDLVLLDVGCGVGVTACYLARKYGCRVVGVDISEAMVTRSRQRARKMGLEALVEFHVADLQDLPYEDKYFNAVISESATAFAQDKQQAINEYVRVTRTGGFIGLNESTWLASPPPEVVAWVSQDVGGNAMPLSRDEWSSLLEHAGLESVSVEVEKIDVRAETKGIFQRYGYVGMLRIFSRILLLMLRNPAYRKFLKGIREQGLAPNNVDNYMGYGIYVGRKV